MRIEFEMEKETKNTVRFKEVCEENPVIGTVYIPKTTLESANWKNGEKLILELTVEDK